MSDIPTLAEQAPVAESPAEQENNPFEGFSTEAFDAGEPIEEAQEPAAADEVPPEPAVKAEGEGAAADAAAEDAESPAPKKAQTAQERINELTRARREAEREAAELRKRLEALEKRSAEPEKAPAKTADAESADEGAKGPPKPEDFEFGELDSAYIAAVVDYQTERRFAEFQQRQEEAQQQAAVRTKFEQQIEQGRQKYADFDEVVVKGAQEGAWPLSETLGVLLVESEVGEDIAYHLASNPDEAASVDRLAPVEQARYFGRLEAKFSAARAAAAGDDAVTPVTTKAPKAPPPVTPGKGAGGRFQATASSDDFAAFETAAMKGN